MDFPGRLRASACSPVSTRFLVATAPCSTLVLYLQVELGARSTQWESRKLEKWWKWHDPGRTDPGHGSVRVSRSVVVVCGVCVCRVVVGALVRHLSFYERVNHVGWLKNW